VSGHTHTSESESIADYLQRSDGHGCYWGCVVEISDEIFSSKYQLVQSGQICSFKRYAQPIQYSSMKYMANTLQAIHVYSSTLFYTSQVIKI